MNVPFYAFPAFVRGDTAHLAFVAKRRALFSGFVDLRPLAGAVLTWTVRRAGQTDLVKSTAANGGLTLDTARSRVDWAISAQESATLGAGANHYQVRATFPDGRVETLLTGIITTGTDVMAYDEAYATQSADPNVIEVVQVFNDATLEECMSRTGQMLADLAVGGIAGLPGALDQIGAAAAASARRSSRRYALFFG